MWRKPDNYRRPAKGRPIRQPPYEPTAKESTTPRTRRCVTEADNRKETPVGELCDDMIEYRFTRQSLYRS